MDRPFDELPLFSSLPSKPASPNTSFPDDPWLASSALQKAIRRSDTAVAATVAEVAFVDSIRMEAIHF
jgi:hypothetical protein